MVDSTLQRLLDLTSDIEGSDNNLQYPSGSRSGLKTTKVAGDSRVQQDAADMLLLRTVHTLAKHQGELESLKTELRSVGPTQTDFPEWCAVMMCFLIN